MSDGASGPDPAVASARRLGEPRRLFVAALCALWLGQAAAAPVNDAQAMALVAESLVLDGSFEYLPGHVPNYSVVSPDGRAYCKYGMALSLLMVPAVWADRAVSLGVEDADLAALTSTLCWHLVPSILGALAFLFAAALGLHLGLDRRTALIGATATVLTTPCWVYARQFYAEGLMVACVLGVMLYALRGRTEQPLRNAALCGLWGSVALLAKPTGAILLVAAGCYLLVPPFRGWRALSTRVGAMAAGALPLVALALWYNHLRTGGLLGMSYESVETFSTPPWEGLFGLLLSPGRGLLWYAPLVAAGVLVLWRKRREHPVWLLTGTSVAFFVPASLWWAWHGGECWGPRLIVPIVPLLVVPAAFLLASRRGRRVFATLAALGLAVQLLGASIAWTEHYRRVPYESWAERTTRLGPDAPIDRHYLDEVHYTAAKNPVVGHAWLLWHLAAGTDDLRGSEPWQGGIEDAPTVDYTLNWWPLTARGPGSQAYAWTLVALLGLGAGVSGRRAWKANRDGPVDASGGAAAG